MFVRKFFHKSRIQTNFLVRSKHCCCSNSLNNEGLCIFLVRKRFYSSSGTKKEPFTESEVEIPMIQNWNINWNDDTQGAVLDTHEEAEDEILQVEIVTEDEVGETTFVHSDAHASSGVSVEYIKVIDPFAPAKVRNFTKRMLEQLKIDRTTQSLYAVEVREVEGEVSSDGERGYYRARWRLPLPPEYGARYGEALAPTAKEAEIGAAMHAERIIDALGFQLFQLTSKQKKHAEDARKNGRWAPLPSDSLKSPETPSPPSLQVSVQNPNQKEKSSPAARMMNVHFNKVRREPCICPFKYTIASPYFLDENSGTRIKKYFSDNGFILIKYTKVFQMNEKTCSKSTSSPFSSGNLNSKKENDIFLVRIRLPLDKRFGERVCMGKANSRQTAFTLACMHAELTLDALGILLFPPSATHDPDGNKQRQHRNECLRVNRWAADPDEGPEWRFDTPSPPPLELEDTVVHATNFETFERNEKDGSQSTAQKVSFDSLLLEHTKAVEQYQKVLTVSQVNNLALHLLQLYFNKTDVKKELRSTSLSALLPAKNTEGEIEIGNLFLVEALGIQSKPTFRASITVPLALRDAEKEKQKQIENSVMWTTFVAIGISENEHFAKQLAAMHALETIRVNDEEALVSHKNNNKKTIITLPPFRQVSNTHLGRITVAGMNHLLKDRREQITAEGRKYNTMLDSDKDSRYLDALKGRSQRDPARVMSEKERAITEARATLPSAEWSLRCDVDKCVVVGPNATEKTTKNFVHTLSSVRCPDPFTTARLKDYLERHGKRLDLCLRTVKRESRETYDGISSECQGNKGLSATQNEDEKMTYCSFVTLPFAVREYNSTKGQADAPLIAQGESGTEADSIAMCAIHAELLLDATGVCMYDNVILQERHANTCAMLGRWAPSHLGDAAPSSTWERDALDGEHTASQPPIFPALVCRAEADSALWSSVESRRKRQLTEDKTSAASCQTTRLQNKENDRNIPQKSSIEPKTTSLASSDAHLGTTAILQTDDELCNLHTMEVVRYSKKIEESVRHIRHYCKRRGLEFERTLKQYSVNDPTRGVVYRAIAEVPVPPGYGKRIAVGCANNKKLALFLCAEHATRILKVLRIPIYTNANTTMTALNLDTDRHHAVSPPGLCFFDDLVTIPEVPLPPATDTPSHEEWHAYISKCQNYIKCKDEVLLQKTLLEKRQAPRSGIAFIDKGLEAVERSKINFSAKLQLDALCRSVGLPAKPYFDRETQGVGEHKIFYCRSPVLGTPFYATGVGKNGNECVQATAMHYEYIIQHVVKPNGCKSNNINYNAHETGERQNNPLSLSLRRNLRTPKTDLQENVSYTPYYDVSRASFTNKGKKIALLFYAATTKPYKPILLSFKTSVKGHSAYLVGLAQLQDESQLLVLGKGEIALKDNFSTTTDTEKEAYQRAKSDEAERGALNDLFSKMQQKAGFQDIMQFIRNCNPLYVTPLTAQLPQIRHFANMQLEPNSGDVAQDENVLIDHCKQLLVFKKRCGENSSEISKEKDDYGGDECIQILEELIRQHVDETAYKNRPLSLSSRFIETLSDMGLLSANKSEELHKIERHTLRNKWGDENDRSITDYALTIQGFLVTNLLQCFPPFPSTVPQSPTDLHLLDAIGSKPRGSDVFHSTTKWGALSHAGPFFKVQLAKLILAGFLLHAPALAIRVVAVVMSMAMHPKAFLHLISSQRTENDITKEKITEETPSDLDDDNAECFARDVVELTMRLSRKLTGDVSSEPRNDSFLNQPIIKSLFQYEEQLTENVRQMVFSQINSQEKDENMTFSLFNSFKMDAMDLKWFCPTNEEKDKKVQLTKVKQLLRSLITFATFPSFEAAIRTEGALHCDDIFFTLYETPSDDEERTTGPKKHKLFLDNSDAFYIKNELDSLKVFTSFDLEVETSIFTASAAGVNDKKSTCSSNAVVGALVNPFHCILATANASGNATKVIYTVEEVRNALAPLLLLHNRNIPVVLSPSVRSAIPPNSTQVHQSYELYEIQKIMESYLAAGKPLPAAIQDAWIRFLEGLELKEIEVVKK